MLESSLLMIIFNRMVDAIFVADIAVTFFLPYRASRAQGGLLISDNRKIAMNYLKGWFSLDVFTSIPFDLVAQAILDASSLPDEEDVREFRLFKMFRLLKLMRVLRASRILKRWRDRVSISWVLPIHLGPFLSI